MASSILLKRCALSGNILLRACVSLQCVFTCAQKWAIFAHDLWDVGSYSGRWHAVLVPPLCYFVRFPLRGCLSVIFHLGADVEKPDFLQSQPSYFTCNFCLLPCHINFIAHLILFFHRFFAAIFDSCEYSFVGVQFTCAQTWADLISLTVSQDTSLLIWLTCLFYAIFTITAFDLFRLPFALVLPKNALSGGFTCAKLLPHSP